MWHMLIVDKMLVHFTWVLRGMLNLLRITIFKFYMGDILTYIIVTLKLQFWGWRNIGIYDLKYVSFKYCSKCHKKTTTTLLICKKHRKMNSIELQAGSILVGATAPKIKQMNMCKKHEIRCSVYALAKYRSHK